jgi:hypothetical protein
MAWFLGLTVLLEGSFVNRKAILGQIACIVSVSYFSEIGGNPEQLGVERFGGKTMAAHDVGSGTPDERSQRFCRLVLHASHAKTFVPLLVNGQPVAVVVPPLGSREPNAPPEGPWIRIEPIP